MPRIGENVRTVDGYDVLVVDPPWPKKKGGLRKVAPNQTRELDYQTMQIPDIFNLLDREVFCLARETHTVFMWGIDQFLHDGEKEMANRGYRMHCRLIWNKTNGVAPAFSVRFAHEYVGWFYKPSFTPVATESRGKLTTVFEEKAREHSRKPDCFYTMIEEWFPSARKLDVFSREKRNGWDQFGNQTDHFNLEGANECPP